MQGRRTALPRHRTLSATLDWSYDQLPEVEQLVLRRLAIFVGSFTMEAASAVLAQADMPPATIVDAIANLVAKSLVSADVERRDRLLPAVRGHAGLCADEARGERRARTSRPVACRLLPGRARKGAGGLGDASPPPSGWQRHRHLIDNVRAALDWAFSPGRRSGDRRGDHGRSRSAVVRAVADERMRRTRRSARWPRPPQAGARTARCASTQRRPGR